MRILNREDYEKLARDVVDQFMNKSVPLVDGIVKVANDLALNPDQIRALVQVANTLAHLDLFERKSDGDKVVNFEPANPKAVIEKMYQHESPVGETGKSDSSDLCDFFGDVPDMNKSTSPLSDALSALSAPEATGPDSRHQQIMIIKIRKVAEELKQREKMAGFTYQEGLDSLAGRFANLYGPDYKEFEKDALDVHGGSAVPVLDDLRKMLRLPAIKTAVFEKRARLVDAETPDMQKFAALLSCIEEAKACAAGYEFLVHKVGGVL